jgi:hypothetical protein
MVTVPSADSKSTIASGMATYISSLTYPRILIFVAQKGKELI